MGTTADSRGRAFQRARARGEDTGALLRRYARERDPLLRERLVLRYQPLARSLALRYARAHEPIDDLEQIAMIGLLHALDRFDPDRGFAFTSFAVPTILGELRRAFRSTGWAAYVPRKAQERLAHLRPALDELATALGRSPRVDELAAALHWSEEEVLDGLMAAQATTATSLEAPGPLEDDEGGALLDRLGDDEPGYRAVEDRAAIEAALPALSAEQRTALRLRFEEGLRQSEIAALLGVSQMQVSRIVRAALERLTIVAAHHLQLAER
jgi:RNA polymerase sigma-B factor